MHGLERFLLVRRNGLDGTFNLGCHVVVGAFALVSAADADRYCPGNRLESLIFLGIGQRIENGAQIVEDGDLHYGVAKLSPHSMIGNIREQLGLQKHLHVFNSFVEVDKHIFTQSF